MTVFTFTSCIYQSPESNKSLATTTYGIVKDNEVIQYSLKNAEGMQVNLINYGATITDIIVPDRTGNFENVVLAFDSLSGYLQSNNPYLGATIGRYANRIANAEFSLNGQRYQLSPNNFENTLHGGHIGFDKVIWEAEVLSSCSLLMRYESKDGEEGYPGNLKVTVQFTLDDNNSLSITYKATTDKATPVNLTNHTYFNLSGFRDNTILNHQLFIRASEILAVDDLLIPTGDILPLSGNAFDFFEMKSIGRDIAAIGGGYDHNYILSNNVEEPAAIIYDPLTGRVMELFTDQPGLQFYSGNFLDGTLEGQRNNFYAKHAGLCLEPQQFPDAPNQSHFPNVMLYPGEIYTHVSKYNFSVRN